LFMGVARALGDRAGESDDREPPTLAPGWRTIIDSTIVG
jgi:hypothetical protein